jgi:hypothetical protein
VEETVKTKLILDSVDAWPLSQHPRPVTPAAQRLNRAGTPRGSLAGDTLIEGRYGAGIRREGYANEETGKRFLRRYVESRIAEGAERATVQREIAALRRMFRLGLQASIVLRVPYFPTIQVDNVRSGFFERDQFEAVRAELPDYLQPLVTASLLDGVAPQRATQPRMAPSGS